VVDTNGVPDDRARLVRMFRHFAELEFRGSSPVYERLALALADQPGLAEPLLAAPPGQRRALLYFAAAQYLLRTSLPAHPLRAYLPNLGGERAPDGGLLTTFTDLVRNHGGDLAELCATRTTQTNEARRAALLRPGFGRAAGLAAGRPVALIELGTSAGLLLLPDRFGYRYVGAGRVERHGRADAPPALTMECEVRGPAWPEVAIDLAVATRTGIDLNPVDPADDDAVTWLRSCIWPEHAERLARLDAALAEARATGPTLIAGDLVARLPAVLAAVHPAALPVVFTSNALTYLSPAAWAALVATLAAVGADRDLAVVLNEAAICGLQLFSTGAPRGPKGLVAQTLTVVAWRAGSPSVEALALAAPHGSWLEWRPGQHPYRPIS
jgi:hypothetical protein